MLGRTEHSLGRRSCGAEAGRHLVPCPYEMRRLSEARSARGHSQSRDVPVQGADEGRTRTEHVCPPHLVTATPTPSMLQGRAE
jgi:hypothetical protein